VFRTPRPDWLKRMPQRRAFPWRDGWDAMKDGIMLELLRKKFSDPKRAEQLLSTGERPLIEGNIWGIATGRCARTKTANGRA